MRGALGVAAAVLLAAAASSAADYAALDWVIDSALQQPHLAGAEVGVVVESLENGGLLYERNADRPMIPASNLKLVTAAAALSLFGPDYRFETAVLSDAPPAGSTLKGSLYVRGTGDPSFVSEEMWKLAESVRVLGIDRIEGDLVLDSSYFDSLSTASPTVADGDRAYHARTGALSVNFNSIAVHVTPGRRAGEPATVRLAPETSFVRLSGSVTTGAAGSRPTLSVRRTFEDGVNVIAVGGSVPAGSETRTNYRSLEDGLDYFGTVLRESLEREGVTVEGGVVPGAVPVGAHELLVHESKPLSLVVRDLNKYSNNFVAEQLLKAMSARAGGAPGTTAGGVAVLGAFLTSVGADSSSFRIVDGSGFSRENRLTPRTILRVLRAALADFGLSYEYVASLSVSGTDGTLADRMRYPALARAVRAKTGLLDGVSAISGVMENASGEELLFSIVVNGFECDAWLVHDFEHSVLAFLAGE